jgi:hypothetical protein
MWLLDYLLGIAEKVIDFFDNWYDRVIAAIAEVESLIEQSQTGTEYPPDTNFIGATTSLISAIANVFQYFGFVGNVINVILSGPIQDFILNFWARFRSEIAQQVSARFFSVWPFAIIGDYIRDSFISDIWSRLTALESGGVEGAIDLLQVRALIEEIFTGIDIPTIQEIIDFFRDFGTEIIAIITDFPGTLFGFLEEFLLEWLEWILAYALGTVEAELPTMPSFSNKDNMKAGKFGGG